MAKQSDRRIAKTKRAINEAFLCLLKQKNLNRITVTELSALADINKGTFYLHYNDIYALYNEVLLDYITRTATTNPVYSKMLTDPELFIREFFAIPDSPKEDIEQYLFKSENIQYCQELIPTLINAIIKIVYESNFIVQTKENDLKLRFLIGGMYTQVMFTDISREDLISEAFAAYMANQIRTSFPEAFPESEIPPE